MSVRQVMSVNVCPETNKDGTHFPIDLSINRLTCLRQCMTCIFSDVMIQVGEHMLWPVVLRESDSQSVTVAMTFTVTDWLTVTDDRERQRQDTDSERASVRLSVRESNLIVSKLQQPQWGQAQVPVPWCVHCNMHIRHVLVESSCQLSIVKV